MAIPSPQPSPHPPLHPDLAHLASLLGVWTGPGHGEYPTIPPFDYGEELTIGHVGKPFLSWSQKTRRAGDGPPEPLHAEAGYLRPVGLDRLELVLVQPSGIVEMYDEGTVARDGADDAGFTIRFARGAVTTTATAKSVTDVVREYRFVGDALTYDIAMAAVGEPLTHHLHGELRRS